MRAQQASDPAASLLLGLLGIVIQGVDALVGLDCSPITVIGVGTGNSCSANAVCCQNNNVVRTRLVARTMSMLTRLSLSRTGRPHLHRLRPRHPLSVCAYYWEKRERAPRGPRCAHRTRRGPDRLRLFLSFFRRSNFGSLVTAPAFPVSALVEKKKGVGEEVRGQKGVKAEEERSRLL